MPPFPDRESSLLAKLYQTAPWTTKLHQEEGERVGRGGRGGGGEGGGGGAVGGGTTETQQLPGADLPLVNGPLLGIQNPPAPSQPLITTGTVHF